MPVVEDGLSDSENLSGDEQLSPVVIKSNNRHQSIIPSHKQQFAKSVNNEHESSSKSFYIRPEASSSNAQKISSEESPTIPTGRFI
jgi:hypothetical protein